MQDKGVLKKFGVRNVYGLDNGKKFKDSEVEVEKQFGVRAKEGRMSVEKFMLGILEVVCAVVLITCIFEGRVIWGVVFATAGMIGLGELLREEG